MTKIQFLLALRDRLTNVPAAELEERLRFYTEMIEDRVEEGLSEEDAVAAAGSVEEIAAQILAEFPKKTAAPEKPNPKKRQNVWGIVLLVLGSPLWLSLLLAAFSVLLALYVSLWAVIASLWSVPIALAACGLAGVLSGTAFACLGKPLTGIALLGAGLICAGLSLLLFFGCSAVSKGTVRLTKSIFHPMKKNIVRKEVEG